MTMSLKQGTVFERLSFVAKTFGVKLKQCTPGKSGHFPDFFYKLNDKHDSLSGTVSAAIDPTTRTVHYLDHPGTWELHTYLHEIMHAALQPPRLYSLSELDESILILPFERRLGRLVCSTDREWNEILNYQANTTIGHCHPKDAGHRDHSEVAAWGWPERSAWFRRGIERAKDIGLLDKAGRVTWRKPDWSAWDPAWNLA